MTPRRTSQKLMIMDACVLIDFIKADRSILELVVKHVGPLHVASPIVDEVNEIDGENELVDLGLVIVEPELEDAFAATSKIGPTSFQDRLCLLVAKRYSFTCVTNDKNLRKLCEQEKVPFLWGLELIVELHHASGISAEDACDIAQKIHESNPKHITPKIIERFTAVIGVKKKGKAVTFPF